jgi:Kef-type K+ transport system membrane component KefB
MLDIAVIVVLARLFGWVARRFRQPAVIGEIVAGIALGPSLLGLLPGHLDSRLFPADVQPYLKILAELGLVLFMFIVGLELDVALIRGHQRRAGTISLASIVAPFALGALLTVGLYPLHDVVDGKKVPLLGLMLFMGVAMSVTAFPVLARILAERHMNRTSIGVLALAAAAVDDILAWTLLAFVYAVVKGNGLGSVVRIVALSALFVTVMFAVVRPLLARMMNWYRRAGRVTPDMLAVVLVGVLLSALITERIGIHEIFGAFLFGAIMPRAGAHEFRREILERLEQVSVLLLLPVFFVVAGFGVNVRAFRDPGLLWQLVLILAVAIGGKFGGAFAGARIQRMSFQHSAAIAVLMNTRGLTELVILLIGKQVGVLDTEMFTMMVVMALLTTVITEPLLRIVYPDKAVQRDIEAAIKAELGGEQIYRVLVVADAAPGWMTERLLRLADAALAGRSPGEILLSRILETDAHTRLELGADQLPDLAAMAEAVEALEDFAAHTVATEAPLRVLCRFGSASGEDLIGQVQTSGAEAVALTEDWVRRHPGAFDALDAVTVLIVPAELPAVWLAAGSDAAVAVSDEAVYVRDDGTADGFRAVLVAVAAAARSGRALIGVVPDGDGRARRRLQQAFEPLRSRTTPARVASWGELPALADGGIGAAARVLDRVGGSQGNLRDAVAGIV